MISTYTCPNCTQLCQYYPDDAGQKTPCPHCGIWITIPESPDLEAVGVCIEQDEPLPGFYKEAFLSGWKIFFNPSSIIAMVLIIALTCLKFFVGHTDFSFTAPGFRLQLPIGQITTVVALGGMAWYYMELVTLASFDTKAMPAPEGCSGLELIMNIFRSLYYFIAVLIIVEMPFMILATVIEKITGPLPGAVRLILMFMGLFLFPMGILTVSAGRDIWMIFSPKYMLVPIKRAFPAYLPVAIMVIILLPIEFSRFQAG